MNTILEQITEWLKGIRPYQTDNYYSILERQAQAEKEVNQIVRKKQKNIPKKRKRKTGGNPSAGRPHKA